MNKKSNKELCIYYLEKYAEKNLNAINNIFSDDIILRDWKIYVYGKKKALEETKKNFESVNSIDIKILSTLENQNTVAAELKISINSEEELYVVDVITFNPEGKIKSIRAYLGRGDD